ncbi:MAG TPA: PEP-CTERM sorting domain-containing protein [Methylophilaceae bacterium]|nr:PEP-CTERM sorting domain-containing protein [Methylophilaceae bacterium]
MFPFINRALLALVLLVPFSALADIIRWEVHSTEAAIPVMGENFLLTGGFDFNTATNEISNVTIKTSASGCVACNDFSGADGTTFPAGPGGGVQFMAEYGPDGDIVRRNHFLQLWAAGPLFDSRDFDVSQPGSYFDIDIDHWGLIVTTDPLDPELFESVGCVDCAFAVGTLVPIPEPETNAMIIAGLGVLGWRAKRKANQKAALRLVA